MQALKGPAKDPMARTLAGYPSAKGDYRSQLRGLLLLEIQLNRLTYGQL